MCCADNKPEVIESEGDFQIVKFKICGSVQWVFVGTLKSKRNSHIFIFYIFKQKFNRHQEDHCPVLEPGQSLYIIDFKTFKIITRRVVSHISVFG